MDLLGEEERESLNGALLQFVDRPAELDEKPKDERKYHPMEKRPEEEVLFLPFCFPMFTS